MILGVLVCLTACGTSEVVRESRKTINGDWRLTNVEYPGNSSSVSVNLLGDSSSECFTGSQWNFISNNNTGTYVLSSANCSQGTRHFNWGIEDVNGQDYTLTFKPTDSRNKSQSGNQGFRLSLVHLTQDQMVWEQTVGFEGQPFTIRMNFNKN